MTDWIDEILTPLNTEGERARGDEGEKKEKRRGLRMTAFLSISVFSGQQLQLSS